MSAFNQLQEMLTMVAEALGDELLREVAFVGGCATGLLLTDEVTKEAVRYTDDVDLITNVIGYPQWVQFQDQIKKRGFKESMEDDVTCRMRLGKLIVDFMPDDKNILGYSNRWYREALKEAMPYQLQKNLEIRVVTPAYFVATKLEAYKGRGNSDPMQSRDIEDILNIFDGREEFVEEVKRGSKEIQEYISEELSKLLEDTDFEYAVQSAAKGQPGRENIIFERLEAVTANAR